MDHEALRERLLKETDKLQKLILKTTGQLGNEKFLNGAPPHIVDVHAGETRGIRRADPEKSRHARWSLISSGCGRNCPDRRIEWHAVIGSTMTEASRLAAEGATSGTVVGAEEQTAG